MVSPMTASGESAVRRKLPIGIQTFREIREDGCYYVDKTDFVRRLVEGGKHYFLSRPRRFGKSLLLDTIKELFEGSEALFRGLAIHDEWDWTPHPVVRLSFGSGNFAEPGYLREDAAAQLAEIERRAGVRPSNASAPIRFRELVKALREPGGPRVILLVDEYDKPILDAPDAPEVARANRDFLRGLYSVIKDCDADIKFTLLTGVSKFSKVSIFSGLNNLKDITLDPRYSAICGYTERDLDDVFAPELPGLDRKEVRRWYNGYNWRGEEKGKGKGKGKGKEKVYNPFDILLLFDSREFNAHWFETGSPRFLIDTLLRRGTPTLDLESMVGSEALLSAFDVDEMFVEALLFQTGYLTIVDEDASNGLVEYQLGYPNQEVRQSLNDRLLTALLPDAPRRLARKASPRKLLAANDFEGLEALLRAVFAAIPHHGAFSRGARGACPSHEWHTRNDIRDYEGYYASVVYSYFAAKGLDVVAEDSSAGGRADLVVRGDEGVHIFEFKLLPDASRTRARGEALAQIKARGYADKYRQPGRPVHLIGVEFSREARNIATFEVEQAA